MDGKLYRREVSMPYLRCIARTEISSVIHEIHGGFCRNHTYEPSLSKKILHKGCFLPTMKKNCIEYVRKCEQCHWYAKIVSDNGKHFDSQHFTDFCAHHGIVKGFLAVARPQANG
ncbi:hypothetical protein CsatB_017197 [Cannabis sativa]|uniref:uncharacterized protein LOC133036044 n=1 Tax=Cannabis sativa TaxID=3483 RepID=UPI0029CA122D|nr:uncharacterized protein LOC133036044 [Cannabis sativa]